MIIYIFRYIRFVYSLYLFNINGCEANINYIKKCSTICGPLAIKLLQLIITSCPEFIKSDKLDFVFENCSIHDFKFTKQLYLKDFGKDICDDYIFGKDCIIGSGSIGQVYKCYCKKSDQFVAIKVKHPGINENVDKTVWSLKIVCFLLRFINKYHSVFLEYINNIYLQIDYIQEVKNTQKLHHNFRNEECIIVPEIYNFSENFIIMSYHQSKRYCEVNNQSQLLASMYMNFFYLSSVLVHDYLHADLHNGNWKVIENGNDIKLFIYDCGIMCSTGNRKLNEQIIDTVSGGRHHFMKFFDFISDKKIEIPFKKLQELENICSICEKKASTSEVLTKFIRKIIDFNLLNNKNFINILTSIAILGETPKKSISVFVRYILYPKGTNALLYHIYIDVLEKMNKFTDFKKYLINYLDNLPEKKELYSNWLFEEFGHRKGYILSNIIYDHFFPNQT